MHESREIVSVRDLWKSYGKDPVLRGIDFSMTRGERVGLMGPSGSGKSTLLNCLGGIASHDRGAINIDGNDLDATDGPTLSRLRREIISSIFQFFHLLPTLTVAENIEFPLQLAGVPRDERVKRTAALVEAVSLGPRRAAYPDELSGGEMQRVAIARALVVRPRLILADEPTGNLDSANGEAVLDLLEKLTDQYDTALLLVTHSREATRICHRTVHMMDGHMLARQGAAPDSK